MGLEHALATVFRMTDAVWERHANPWSVWTRYSALPLLVLAVWSRVWIGWWSLAPILGTLVWIWLNPRVFARPKSTKNWASKAVLGERVWLNRKQIPIPKHHKRAVGVLNAINVCGSSLLLYGLVVLDMSATVIGASIVLLGKSWFLDRMVWLFEEMVEDHPTYRQWRY